MPRKRRARMSCCGARRKSPPPSRPDGTLWLAWMAGGQISVASSNDAGRSFSTPVQVTKGKLNLDWGPDARPQIVVEKNGGIALAFSLFRDKAFNGQVLATKSADGGKSFAEPKPITSNNESQRFVALGLDADGSVFSAWIDKRNRVPAKQEGKKYEGAGLFFASSKDGSATYTEAQLASDNTCECCRLGLAFAGPGRPVVVFRNIFEGGVRDHAIMTFGDPADAGRGSPRQQGRLADCCVPASWAKSFDLGRRRLSCDLVHQWQGAQGAVLCPLAGRGPYVFRTASDRPRRSQSHPPLRPCRPARHHHGLERVRWRENHGQRDDLP